MSETSTRQEEAGTGAGRDGILSVENVRKSYGGLIAVEDASFAVEQDEILSLIGPNGAGKTTLFNVINGFLEPDHGTVLLNGVDVTGEEPHVHTEHGMARTFQTVQPFEGMTIRENLMVGAYSQTRSREEAESRADEVLEYLDIADVADLAADGATVKQQKYMELGRAISTEPDLLLIDEIIAGLNDEEMQEMLDILRQLNDDGMAIVLVEHVMDAVMDVSDRIVVLSDGVIIANGPPSEIATDERVIEAYLGEQYDGGDGDA